MRFYHDCQPPTAKQCTFPSKYSQFFLVSQILSSLCLPCPEEMLTSLGSQNVTFEALSACKIGLGKKYKDLEENLILGTATFFYDKHSFPTLGSTAKKGSMSSWIRHLLNPDI